jgi:hypothetical protein
MQYNTAATNRDNTYNAWIRKLGSNDEFIKFKQTYHNNRVGSIVTNDSEIKDYDIQNDEMVRLKDAIYRMPESVNGRAHFYAPYKRFHHVTFDTFWFNLVVIWLFSGLLFTLLYYDILRKIIAYFETLRLNRLNQRRFLRIWVTEQPDMWKSAKK